MERYFLKGIFQSYQDTISSCNISEKLKNKYCGLTVSSVDFPFILLHCLKLGMKAVESERTDHLIISSSVVSIDCVCVRATSSFYQSVSTKSLCNECCGQDGRWQRLLSEQTLFFNNQSLDLTLSDLSKSEPTALFLQTSPWGNSGPHLFRILKPKDRQPLKSPHGLSEKFAHWRSLG